MCCDAYAALFKTLCLAALDMHLGPAGGDLYCVAGVSAQARNHLMSRAADRNGVPTGSAGSLNR